MRLIGHCKHVRKSPSVDYWEASIGVVRVLALAMAPTLLPIVVEADIAVAKITERSGHTVHRPVTGHHALHDLLDELLVDIGTIEVPRAPSHRWSDTSSIIDAKCGEHECRHDVR